MVSAEQLRIYGIILIFLVVGKMQADEWQEVSRSAGLTIFTRHCSGSAIEEVRAIGQFDAPMDVVRDILSKVQNYQEFMPYTKESRVLSKDEQLCYLLVAPPLLEPWDCTIRVFQRTEKGADGTTIFYSTWQEANDKGPSQRPGIARMTINHGSWLLEPVTGGTRATCTMYTDPGGMPARLANIINRQGVAHIFEALRARARGREQEKIAP
jgi:Polyketide cyclase / dehydrase and lipid transport